MRVSPSSLQSERVHHKNTNVCTHTNNVDPNINSPSTLLHLTVYGIVKSSYKHEVVSHELQRRDYFWGQLSSLSLRISSALYPFVFVFMSSRMMKSAFELVGKKNGLAPKRNRRPRAPLSTNPATDIVEETQM